MSEFISMNYLTVSFTRPLAPMEATLGRGCLGRRFPDEILIHNHDGKRLVYSYPRIQTKVMDGKLVIVGIEEGRETVSRLAGLADLDLGKETLETTCSELRRQSLPLGEAKSPISYSFKSPWLALNERNASRYRNFRSTEKRQALLSRILVGNILSMAKGLGVVVAQSLTATLSVEECKAHLKGTRFIAFRGDFTVNFEIPNYIGIGKSVSRGFGTVVRVEDSRSI